MHGDYDLVGLLGICALGLGLLAAALFAKEPAIEFTSKPAWTQRRFAFTVYALIFLAFDMEMIFMYPWAVVFAGIGLSAFLDMLVFIAILSSGIAYAWGMGGFKWE